jgi:glyoxylase-like metal-dependent hydrolase (beta-lactamase superfamily II)
MDTGWCRDISPRGVYDPEAVRKVLPPHLAALFHPYLPKGMAIHEQLAAMGIRPEELDCVLLTHLDADHVAGLRHVNKAKRIILPEDEYFWSCRTVYKTRQPWSLWHDQPIERLYYRGSPLGPNRWAIDLFGDESIQLVNVPGHTDGQAAIVVRGHNRFVLLAADAAYSPRNWQEMITPGFGFAREWQLKSLNWIAEMAADPGCAAVLCSHDPAIIPTLISI